VPCTTQDELTACVILLKWFHLQCSNGLRAGNHRHFHSGLHESTADCVTDKTCSLVDIQFLHEPHPMRFSRFDTDTQNAGSIFRGFSFGNQLQHLTLADRQGIRWPIGFGPIGLHHRARNSRAKIELTAGDLLNGMDEVTCNLIL